MADEGPWIETFTHQKFYLMNPDPSKIFIEDIAQHLVKQCRFVGASQRFYSVLEHCIIMARLASRRAKLPCLLHEGHETYLNDMSRPLKLLLEQEGRNVTYQTLAARIDRAIEEGLGIEFRCKAEVKYWDNAMLRAEASEIMNSPLIAEWTIPHVPEQYVIEPAVFHSLTIKFREVKDYIDYTVTKFLELYEKYKKEELLHEI